MRILNVNPNRQKCEEHHNYAVCKCGGCALCCKHEENPQALKELRSRFPGEMGHILAMSMFNDRHQLRPKPDLSVYDGSRG